MPVESGRSKRRKGGKGGAVVPIEWHDGIPRRCGADLWDFRIADGSSQQAGATASPSAAAGSPPAASAAAALRAAHQHIIASITSESTPAVELRRAGLVAELRSCYARACRENLWLEQPPADSIDRWLLEQLAQPRVKATRCADPLLPKPRIAEVSRVLLRELLAEVPYRCPTRTFGDRALTSLRTYHARACQWLDRLDAADSSQTLKADVESLGEWLGNNAAAARSAGRPRPEECPFKRKLEELAGKAGLSSRFWVFVEPRALAVIKEVSLEAERVARLLQEPAADAANGTLASEEVHLQEDPASGSAVLRYAGDEIHVAALHVRKLRALYEVHNQCPSDAAAAAEWAVVFRRRLYVMLRRYVTFIGLDPSEAGLVGGNMHAAAPEKVFVWLREQLGVRCELFASPLNCYFSHFCSAFPDVDAPFGSLGSFFDADFVREGSYEVGPPYTEEVLELTSRRLLQLFRNPSAGPLSFVLFVPDWPGAGGLEILDGPEFASFRRSQHGGPFVLARGRDHHYVSGIQFFADAGEDAARRYYVVPHGTRVYVLQNDAGAVAWKFTKEHERALLEQMRP